MIVETHVYVSKDVICGNGGYSEQTSSASMLWAKTRVYVCSGRAGGNERHLLFHARFEET